MDNDIKDVIEFLDANYVEVTTNPCYQKLELGQSEIVCFLLLRVEQQYGVSFTDAFFMLVDWDHDRFGLIGD